MTTAAPARRLSARVPGVGAGLALMLATTVVAAGLGAAVAGAAAAEGALVGGALALGVLGAGAVALAVVAAVAPAVSLLLALLTYTLQVLALGLAFAMLAGSQSLDSRWLAGSLAACTVAWLVALLLGAARSREPLYDLPEPTGPLGARSGR